MRGVSRSVRAVGALSASVSPLDEPSHNNQRQALSWLLIMVGRLDPYPGSKFKRQVTTGRHRHEARQGPERAMNSLQYKQVWLNSLNKLQQNESV